MVIQVTTHSLMVNLMNSLDLSMGTGCYVELIHSRIIKNSIIYSVQLTLPLLEQCALINAQRRLIHLLNATELKLFMLMSAKMRFLVNLLVI